MNSVSRILHNSDCDEREKEKESSSDNAWGGMKTPVFSCWENHHAARGDSPQTQIDVSDAELSRQSKANENWAGTAPTASPLVQHRPMRSLSS